MFAAADMIAKRPESFKNVYEKIVLSINFEHLVM